MPNQVISIPNAPAPSAAFSQGFVAGDVVVTAGQIGLDPATNEMVGPGIAEQTRQALANIQAILQAGGADLSDIIKMEVFLTELEDFEDFNRVYAEVMPQPYPARRTVYVRLPSPLKIELDAFAVVQK